MAKGRIRLLSTVPGAANLGSIVREFCKRDGVVTAFSDQAIRTLASLVPQDSAVEVIPFGGLVRRFAVLCGELPSPVAQEGHVAAAIGVACEDLLPDSPFSRTAKRLGLHRALTESLHEMSEHGLTPDEYESLAERSRAALSSKLRSLAQIERDAADTLGRLGRSFSREHFRLCQGSKPEKGAALGRVLVLAGGDFRPQALDLVRWAAAHGASVTVVVYRHAAGVDLYPGAELSSKALAVEAEEVGAANPLLAHLFAETQAEGGLSCSILSTADPLAEAEWALRGCLERRAAGMGFEAMAIYARDSASYAPLLESAAKRLGVPLRMWRRAPLLTNSFARLTLAALGFCASNDVRTLLKLAHTTYFHLDHASRTELSEAVRKAHSARGEQWTMLRAWAGERPDAYPWLVKLLDWRDDSIANPSALEVWIGKLRPLMHALPVDEATSERDRRASAVIERSLMQVASVRRAQGARSLTLGDFARIAGEVWGESDVSLPAGEMGVVVTSQSEALPAVRCLFVLGMLEGVFPRRRSEDPILSDFERQEMSQLRSGFPLPTSKDRAEAERAEFYSVCAAASEELVLSYPETDEERDNVPAFYLEEVRRALGSVETIDRPRGLLTPGEGQCIALSDKEIRHALSQPEGSEPAVNSFQSPSTAAVLARNPHDGVRPTELREALQCPFRFFAARTLALTPNRLRARWFSLVGLPKKVELHGIEDESAAIARLEASLDAELDAMYSDVPPWEVAFLHSGGRRLIREWVSREFGARRVWEREALRTAVRFGEEGLRDVLPKIARLKGSVAGLSRVGPYSVVHLVETSGPAKGYGSDDLSNEDRLYYGVHLLASWEKGSAGALEIETMAGERILVLMPRLPNVNLPARVQDGLRVLDLGGSERSGGQKEFFDDVKELAREAARRIETADVRAIRGDHCMWCDYGELCRQSSEFGEEDSPFADDL